MNKPARPQQPPAIFPTKFDYCLLILIVVCLLGLAFMFRDEARADPNLELVCRDADAPGKPVGQCEPNTWYQRATLDDAVRTCTNLQIPCGWENPTFVYRRLRDVVPGSVVDTCVTDIPVATKAPNPWNSSTDLCKTFRMAPLAEVLARLGPAAPIVNGQGSIAVSWVPPTQNTDGTPLTNLAGYTVYWGTTSRLYPNNLAVASGTSRTFTIPLGQSTTIFLAVTAKNAAGVESAYSNEVSKRFELTVTPVQKVPASPTGVNMTATFTCDAGPDFTCTFTVQ